MKTVEPIRSKKVIEKFKVELAKRGTRDLSLFTIGINTALRISDIIKLKKSDVKDFYVDLKETKTKKNRKFPLNDSVKAVLISYIENLSDDDYLFESRTTSYKGQATKSPMSRQQAYNILNDVADKIGFKSCGTHTMRKTFGYWYYQETHDIATLMDIFNHSSMSITLRYIGINQDIINDSINRLCL